MTRAVRRGETANAIQIVQEHFPYLPESNVDAWLDLKSSHFLDQLQNVSTDADWLAIIQHGQGLWDEFAVEQAQGNREQRLQVLLPFLN